MPEWKKDNADRQGSSRAYAQADGTADGDTNKVRKLVLSFALCR